MVKKFNNLKDRHFPDGYPNWILSSIDESVSIFIDIVSKKFGLESIKIILDVGSLNGIESVKFSEKINNCTIHTFEPNPESYENVIFSTNDFDNIHVHKLAASNFNGKSDFYITHNQGASSLLEPISFVKTGEILQKIEVDVIKLDDWCLENKIDSIDLLWIDVQGSELVVFEGMKNILNTVKGIYVECSINSYYNNGPKLEEVINYLNYYNFKLVDTRHLDNFEGDFIFIKND